MAANHPLSRAAWRTSSYSTNGGDCVEVTAWHTSSYSTNGGECVEVGVWNTSSHSTNGGNCVEVTAQHQAASEIIIAVRDSKDREGPRLHFSAADWSAFCHRVRTSTLAR